MCIFKFDRYHQIVLQKNNPKFTFPWQFVLILSIIYNIEHYKFLTFDG